MQVAEESGTDLAQRVLKKLKMAQRKAQAGASAVRAGVPSPSEYSPPVPASMLACLLLQEAGSCDT